MDSALVVDTDLIEQTKSWVHGRSGVLVEIINTIRTDLGGVFATEVAPVEIDQFQDEVDVVFDDIDRAVNVTALVVILQRLDVEGDYAGFIVDELLGRELAGMIAGEQPLRLLGEATFHYADATVQPISGPSAGLDDLDAALAAGFQTRLPGWPWRDRPTPFE